MEKTGLPIKACKWVSIDKFSCFFSKVPNFKSFHADSPFPNLDYYKVVFELCPLIQEIHIHYFDFIELEELDYFELGKLLNQKIKKLSFGQIGRYNLFKLMVDQMDQLESFESNFLDDYNFISNFKKLKSLDLCLLSFELCLQAVDVIIHSGINETLNHLYFYVENQDDDDVWLKKIGFKIGKYFHQLQSLKLECIKLFWPRKLNLSQLKEFRFYGSALKISMFNENQLLNMKIFDLFIHGEISFDCINGMSKVFPNLKNLRLKFMDSQQFDDESKAKLSKSVCNEISKLNLIKLTIDSTDILNLNDESVCQEICSVIKQMDNLNTVTFGFTELISEKIMEIFIELAKCQPKKWILFPSYSIWETNKFTYDDIPRNMRVNIIRVD